MAKNIGLAIYAAKWDDGDITLVAAMSLEMLAAMLDPIGSPIGLEIRRLREEDVDGMVITSVMNSSSGEQEWYADDESGFDWSKIEKIIEKGELVKITTKHIYGH
jgi:hypothetical protein